LRLQLARAGEQRHDMERLDLRHPPREARGGLPRLQCAPYDSLSFLRLSGPEPVPMMKMSAPSMDRFFMK